jgi:hypothetical protein
MEALRQPGCFLCTLIAGETRRYLGHLLDEYVNDPGFRKTWRASCGFCHRHSWMMADAPEPLGLSILYLDLVDTYGESLLEHPTGGACPVCAAEDRHVKTHLGIVVSHWGDPELANALAKSEGLCGPHLAQALEIMAPGEPREAIRHASVGSISRLRSQLAQLVDSFDYRRQSAQDEAVRRAWLRAIEKLVGVRETRSD